ncbi:HlyD family secretion protein [Pararhizobium sp. BT-229]|uniref:HlyD family secretion protein n=1 Tax=Pararhizobium sp. BT-229 TaxID=2986923 RepID=UPI0021F7A461|nr:HlyD family secretion protein [Pararhizobium sp. BT-229]MCV9966736.1 HlyD family secretion protein [Pararhizobium sp. BT-229]
MSTSHQTGAGIATPVENRDPSAHELHAVESAPAEARARPVDPGAGGSAAATSPAPSRRLGRFVIPLTAIGVVLTLVGATSDRWNAWQGSAAVQVTDNATVRAEMTRLSARVSGNITRVGVSDFQHVKAGDLLLEIDPEDYDAAVAQADANVAAAKAVLANLDNQKALQRGVIAQAEAQRLSALARLEETQQERERQSVLLRGRVSTPQKVEQATSAYDTARATLTASEATIEAQRRQLDVLNGQQGVLAANLRAAEAALRAAELRLGHTRIIAPFDGVVGERHVQEGDYVNIGTQLIAVVPLPAVYVTANYKETQLTRVAPGQPVEVTVDTFPDAVLRGHVARLSPASGSTFAMLPPDNATGNFTKVVQRIPVRIEFDPGQPLVERLRPGMSVVTRIHVTGAAGDVAQTDRADGK